MTIEARWGNLKPTAGHDVFQLYDPDHPLNWYLGWDSDGHRTLLLVISEQPPPPRELRALRVASLKREDGRWSLLFRLNDESLSAVFFLLSADLIESTKRLLASSGQLAYVMKRFTSWQRLLDKGILGLLDEAQVRGLCGELLFLERLRKEGCPPLISAEMWVGPLEADQDFQAPERAWEIKAVRPDAKAVTIASEKQLDSSRQLELVTISLNEHATEGPNTFTLNSLHQRVRTLFETDIMALDVYDDRIRASGYIPNPEYDRKFYSLGLLRRYKAGEGFPCIRLAMLPPGVSRVRYEISLDRCAPHLIADSALGAC